MLVKRIHFWARMQRECGDPVHLDSSQARLQGHLRCYLHHIVLPDSYTVGTYKYRTPVYCNNLYTIRAQQQLI